MNKYQEALNKTNFILRKLSGWSGKDLSEIDNQYDLFNNQALIQELVDKATPKKPIDSFCPICGSYDIEVNIVRIGWEKQKHCPDCGQAIDWSTDERL